MQGGSNDIIYVYLLYRVMKKIGWDNYDNDQEEIEEKMKMIRKELA